MTQEKSVDIWDKITNIPRRVIYWFLVIVMVVSTLVPLNLPITISEPATNFYKTIESIPSGSLVIFAPEASPSQITELGSSELAIFRHAIDRGLKLVILNMVPDAYPVVLNYLDEVGIDEKYTYGVDYVVLGYLVGQETMVASLADDFKSIVKVDHKGTPIEDLPILQNVTNAKDFALVIVVTGLSQAWVAWPRFWGTTYGTKIVQSLSAQVYPSVIPYYVSGLIQGLLGGIRGSAEYEKLIGIPGAAVKAQDMINATHLYVLFWIILGNVGFFSKRFGGKK